jgi:hypothetical protein
MNRREERDLKRADRLNEPPRLLKAGDDSGHYAGFMIDGVFHAVGDWQFRHSCAEWEADEYDATHVAYFDGTSIDYEDVIESVHFPAGRPLGHDIQYEKHKTAGVGYGLLWVAAALVFALTIAAVGVIAVFLVAAIIAS